MKTTKAKTTKTPDPMDALRDRVDALATRLDTEVDRLAGLVSDNKRAAIAAQRRADAAHAKATAAYEKLGKISDALDLVPDQFATAHRRIDDMDKLFSDGFKPAIAEIKSEVHKIRQVASNTHAQEHTAANEKATQAVEHAFQAATSAALAMIKAEAATEIVTKLQDAVAKLEVRVFPTPLSILVKDGVATAAMVSGNERSETLDPKAPLPKVPAS
jgi:hypothetical protein